MFSSELDFRGCSERARGDSRLEKLVTATEIFPLSWDRETEG